MDELPSTANISDRNWLTQLFLMNLNNNLQHTSPYKNILLPAPILGNDKSDTNRPGWQTVPRRMICHNCCQDGHYAPDCTIKFRHHPTAVLNYQNLNVDDEVRVPCTYYNQATRLIEAINELKGATQVKQTEQRSNYVICGCFTIKYK